MQVKPGLPDGTQFVFQREGNQTPATEPGPVVFVLRSEKHPRFSRQGADLLHTATIPLNEALTGTSLPVLMLDGRWGIVPMRPHRAKTSCACWHDSSAGTEDLLPGLLRLQALLHEVLWNLPAETSSWLPGSP